MDMKRLTVMNEKCTDVWDMMPWSPVELYRRSEECTASSWSKSKLCNQE
jgi:hypothetical protein